MKHPTLNLKIDNPETSLVIKAMKGLTRNRLDLGTLETFPNKAVIALDNPLRGDKYSS